MQESELKNWEEIRLQLNLVISDEGIISQYDGYFKLKELDWDYYREKYSNIYRMDRLLKAEGKSADDYKVAKQADTLMTFYNFNKEKVDQILVDLGYNLPDDYLSKNLDYYLARTSHGSTLSRVVHAQLADMAGDAELSWTLYSDALSSDYNDIQGGTTAEGIHAGVMSGTVMIAMSTYAGVDFRGDTLLIEPSLPKQWKRMVFQLKFKNVHYKLSISADKIHIFADADTQVKVLDTTYQIQAHQPAEINY